MKEQAAKILAGTTATSAPGSPPRHRLGLQPARTRGADACADYLENKQDYLGYPAFLEAGWPFASGLIEGAARWLVKDRMQVTGARWSLDGAEAVLRLRALASNGDFDDYFTFHREQENDATTTAATSNPGPAPHNQPRPNCPTFKRAAPNHR